MSTDFTNVLEVLNNLFLVMFVVGSMLALGLSLTIAQIADPLKSVRFVLTALVANFVLIPAIGWAVARGFRLDDSLATGLIIVAVVAGAPFLPKLAQMARAGAASAVALMILVMVVTVGYAPIAIPILISGVSVDAWAIAKPLIVLMLVPLGIGLFVKARWDTVAAEMEDPITQVSNVGLVGLLVLTLALNFTTVLSLIGTRGILASVVFVAAAFAVGWFVAERDRDARTVMGLGTAQRNLSAAVTVATANFASDPNVLVMIIVTSLVMIVMLLAIAGELGKRYEASETAS